MQPYYIEFILAGLAILLLLAEAFVVPKGRKAILALGGIAALVITFILLNFTTGVLDVSDTFMERFYKHDPFSIIFKNIAILSTIMVLMLAWDFKPLLRKFTSVDATDEHTGEFYSLPIFACVGMMWMASAKDFVSIFVALELVTICFYIMVAYMKRNVGSLEAGVKYLILGALSTGILVYGIAWIYGAYGTTNIELIASAVGTSTELTTPALFGLALIIISLAFKVGAVPMQLWIPDVYQGAPTPITAFLSVASKASGFAIAITILQPFAHVPQVKTVLLVLAGATLLYGNLAALKQSNFKRLLAYSSIAHAGFILVALAYGKYEVVIFYLVTYMIMTFAAFFILNSMRIHEGSDEIEAFNGFSKRNPTVALYLTIIMAAMAGLPLTVGFYGKFFVFQAMFESYPNMILAIIAFVSVGAGFYYYLKVIRAMYWHNSENTESMPISPLSRWMAFVLTCAIICYGFYPQPLISLIGM